MKRIFLLLAVTALVVAMLAVGAGTAFAVPGKEQGKGDAFGGGDGINTKDEPQANKTRTGGGPLNNPHTCIIC